MSIHEYFLMNKDQRVLRFTAGRSEYGQVRFEEVARYSQQVPIGMGYIQSWLSKRQAPKHREHILNLLKQTGCDDLEGFVKGTYALSLNDTFWVKAVENLLAWDDVSLYCNDFNELIAKLAFEGGVSKGAISSTSPEYATDGAYAKCWVREDENIFLLKTGSSNLGLEPYSEFYASQLAKLLCGNVVDYSLAEHHGKLVCKCLLFTSENEGYIATSKLIAHDAPVDDLVALFASVGDEDSFRRMIVLDALILNTDRHKGNYGLIFDNNTLELRRMAPMFDHNQSLLCYARDVELDDISDYVKLKVPKIGDDFNAIANAILTDGIKADLLNLKGFRFERNGQFDLDEKRLVVLEQFVDRQIDDILQRKSLYISYGTLASRIETAKQAGQSANAKVQKKGKDFER